MDSLTPILNTLPLITNSPTDLVGFVLPPLIDILSRKIPSEKETERFLASVLICIGITTIIKWNLLSSGSYDEFIKSATLVFTESQIVYRTYFKKSWLRNQMSTHINKISIKRPTTEAIG